MNRFDISELLSIILFLFIFGGVCGAMHAYLFVKLRRHLSRRQRIYFLSFCVVIVSVPFLSRWLRFVIPIEVTFASILVTFTWLAWLFWFCCLALASDGWNLAVRKVAAFRRIARPVSPRLFWIAVAVLIPFGTVWGLIEAAHVQANTITLPILPPESEPIRVVMLTDLHLSLVNGERFMKKIMRRVEELQPDLLVCTGDLADRLPGRMREELRMLAEQEAPLGKFAVFGNHEYYVGRKPSQDSYDAAGFRVLHNESVHVGEVLRVAGVTDRLGYRSAKLWKRVERETLSVSEPDRVTIFLKHRSTVLPDSIGRFDLQLSGHGHGGQIFPYRYLFSLSSNFQDGLHRLKNGSYLFSSRGAGTWGPPMRVLAPPEVNLIILTPRDDL